MKFKVKDKVVPISKSSGKEGLENSGVWAMCKRYKQPFMYVIGTTETEVTCSYDGSPFGDFFLENDLIKYIKN